MTRPSPTPSSPLVFESVSEEDTEQLATAFAAIVRSGDVVALDGPLGAGKTRFVRGLAAALGSVKAFVGSPTFGLVQHYDGELPIVHIDAYRLKDTDEFERMGGRELFEPEAVTLVEWSDRIAGSLPADRWEIRAEHVSEASRRYCIDSTHSDGVGRLVQLRERLRAVSGEREA